MRESIGVGGKTGETGAVTHDAPNHYHVLGVYSWTSRSNIEGVAKSVRIASHPDTLKRQQGLTLAQIDEIDEQAKRVGGAAEVLTDSRARARYDCHLGLCC